MTRTTASTYRVSVHEGANIIRPEHGCQCGWILVEQEIPHMGLRDVITTLRDEGYDDGAILVESEATK